MARRLRAASTIKHHEKQWRLVTQPSGAQWRGHVITHATERKRRHGCRLLLPMSAADSINSGYPAMASATAIWHEKLGGGSKHQAAGRHVCRIEQLCMAWQREANGVRRHGGAAWRLALALRRAAAQLGMATSSWLQYELQMKARLTFQQTAEKYLWHPFVVMTMLLWLAPAGRRCLRVEIVIVCRCNVDVHVCNVDGPSSWRKHQAGGGDSNGGVRSAAATSKRVVAAASSCLLTRRDISGLSIMAATLATAASTTSTTSMAASLRARMRLSIIIFWLKMLSENHRRQHQRSISDVA